MKTMKEAWRPKSSNMMPSKYILTKILWQFLTPGWLLTGMLAIVVHKEMIISGSGVVMMASIANRK